MKKKTLIKDEFFFTVKVILKGVLFHVKLFLALWFIALTIGSLKGNYSITDIEFLYALYGTIIFILLLFIYKTIQKKYPDFEKLNIEERRKGKINKHWWQL